MKESFNGEKCWWYYKKTPSDDIALHPRFTGCYHPYKPKHPQAIQSPCNPECKGVSEEEYKIAMAVKEAEEQAIYRAKDQEFVRGINAAKRENKDHDRKPPCSCKSYCVEYVAEPNVP
jgi:hypothetical protein